MNPGNAATLERNADAVVAAFRAATPFTTLAKQYGVGFQMLDSFLRRHIGYGERTKIISQIKVNANKKRRGPRALPYQLPVYTPAEIETGKQELARQKRPHFIWQCAACAYDLPGEPPEEWQCPKCNSYTAERLEIAETVGVT